MGAEGAGGELVGAEVGTAAAAGTVASGAGAEVGGV